MSSCRTLLILALAALLLSCGRDPYAVDFPLKEAHPENSMNSQWAAKKVLDSLLIDDMEGPLRWSVREGSPDISCTAERCMDGRQSLRYHTSMVDSSHILASRTPWGSFGGDQGGWNCIALEFDTPQDWSAYNRIALWVYIHPTKNPNVSFAFDLVNQGTRDNTLTPGRETNFDMAQGRWERVYWEIEFYPRDSIVRFEICQTMTGYDREIGEQYVTIDFDSLCLERVEPDNYKGWDIPEGQISFTHSGYRPLDKKIALAAYTGQEEFSLLNSKGKAVYSASVTELSNKGVDFALLDFSDFRSKGTYTLRYGDIESQPFPIEEDVWLKPLLAAVNFYYSQRCGFAVEGVHGVCHQDTRGFYGEEQKPINGGWHDAGDLSQGAWRTAYGCYALLSALEMSRERKDLASLLEKLEQEALWGLDWLLKTRFADGRHISWLTQRIYTDNEQGTIDDIITPATFVPWELFQTSSVFAQAAEILPDRQQELAIAAAEDWEYAMRSRPEWESASYLEAAWGAIASSSLYRLKGDEKYRSAAINFGRLLMACQEQDFVDGIPYAGYFYTDTGREHILHYHHEAFNEAAMLAFSALCEALPDDADAALWKRSAQLFCDAYMKGGSAIAAPFNVLPAGIFRRADMNNAFDIAQYEAGVQINEDYAIRTFPIWSDHIFHGSTNFHLSQAWALAEAANLLHDDEAMSLARQQLEWTLGCNPFGRSLMYGVGYGYVPMFAYCTHNVVGALPVGVDCFSNDEPYWNGTANATPKEMWVEPVSRFVGTLSAFLNYQQ